MPGQLQVIQVASGITAEANLHDAGVINADVNACARLAATRGDGAIGERMARLVEHHDVCGNCAGCAGVVNPDPGREATPRIGHDQLGYPASRDTEIGIAQERPVGHAGIRGADICVADADDRVGRDRQGGPAGAAKLLAIGIMMWRHGPGQEAQARYS
jgi:hypothetical protein